MAKYIEKADKLTLPVIALGGITAFPAIPVNFELTDDASIAAANAATATDAFVYLISLQAPTEGELSAELLYKTGTVAKIKQSIKTPDGNMRVICEGYARADLIDLRRFADYYAASVICKTVDYAEGPDLHGEALMREGARLLDELAAILPTLSEDTVKAAKELRSPAAFADFVAANVLVRGEDKQLILECYDPDERMECLLPLMQEEAQLLRVEMEIHREVRERMNQNQKEFYLREQMRVIEEELGDGGESEFDELEARIHAAKLPEATEKKLLKELGRMAKTPFGSSEASVLRAYLEVCLELPWNAVTEDRLDIALAARILDEDHEGLTKVKERVLEFLAVRKLNPSLGNQIICLVGPPGVGKTSVAASIARALNRKYVRVSLGGVRDEADIRGHRKTYLGAMPGRIMAALTEAGVRNPLILLDEIDKMTHNAHGDPASALLEVLDGEQNKHFRDHFVEVPFDLSECLFIATANTLEGVPRPLIDRMEIIELTTYTKPEKMAIAKNHLVPKQLKRHGLDRRRLRITDEAVAAIIDDYTREAGVRNLEREIANVCRKTAKRVAMGIKGLTVVKNDNLEDLLGPRKMPREKADGPDRVGVVNGLAYTEAGGDMLRVEVLPFPGEGKIELTGSLGDVMKESARIAVSYLRANAERLGIPADFYKTKDLHIHFPEGAVPKDGPSAGAAMVTALVSALSGRPVRHDVAMTGEVTLTGNVLPIGGLKEKTMAAATAGVRTVLIPKGNLRDLPLLAPEALAALDIVPCATLDEVLSLALTDKQSESTAATATPLSPCGIKETAKNA